MKKKLATLLILIFIANSFSIVIASSEESKQEQQSLIEINKTITNELYEIQSKYSYIRSYPGGGGIFIIKMTPKNDFKGYVSLQINADSNLNAALDKHVLDEDSQIAELTIQPNEQVDFKTYEIILTATYHKNLIDLIFSQWINKIKLPLLSRLINLIIKHFNNNLGKAQVTGVDDEIVLQVETFNWNSDSLGDAIIKKDDLEKWLEAEHPEYGPFSGETYFAYITYPAHYIVEHWTFLYENWEIRICYHVMIPPHIGQ